MKYCFQMVRNIEKKILMFFFFNFSLIFLFIRSENSLEQFDSEFYQEHL